MSTTFDGIINEPNVDYLGKDGFFWWFGEVVEDKDPLQVGRVKVRISGWYTGLDGKFKEKMPDEDLPWAVVLQPTNQGGQEGTGISSGQLKPGAMVMGFFLDGQEAQQPVVMGVVRAYKPGSVNGMVESMYSGEYDNTGNKALPIQLQVNLLQAGKVLQQQQILRCSNLLLPLGNQLTRQIQTYLNLLV